MTDTVSILTIDDDEQICFALKELFIFQGWRAYTAGNVREGLESFKKNRPQIVLMDYHMPGVNGVEGVRQLRRLSRDVPIVVLTVDESQAVADAFLAAGASDFALKPIKAPDIISRIRLHLRLLEKNVRQAADFPKGLSGSTMALIDDFFARQSDYVTANAVAEGTGLAYQTVYRYLQHLVREERIVAVSTYGKVGRPRQLYRKAAGRGPQKNEKK